MIIDDMKLRADDAENKRRYKRDVHGATFDAAR